MQDRVEGGARCRRPRSRRAAGRASRIERPPFEDDSDCLRVADDGDARDAEPRELLDEVLPDAELAFASSSTTIIATFRSFRRVVRGRR